MMEKALLKQLGKQIVKLRKERNISQVELASKCDFEKSNMSRIESGRTNPTVLTLFKISRVLSVPIAYFFDFELTENKFNN